MGKRGPAPKPTEQKLLEGTYRTDRAPHNEPKPRVMIPRAPEWLQGVALKEYNRHAKMLVGLRVMTEADRLALVAFTYEYGKWREAEEALNEEGPVLYSVKTGAAYLNPWQGIASNHFKNMVKLMQEFGLTPASRSRIDAQPEDEKQTSLAEKLFAGVSHSE